MPVVLISWSRPCRGSYALHRLGRTLLATGGNAAAARLAGRPRRAGQDAAYMVSATLAGLVGLVAMGITSASDANNVGLGIELDAIAAVAVSGTPLTGGRISVVGTVVGAVMLRLLQNTLIAQGVPARSPRSSPGSLIVVALFLQRRPAERVGSIHHSTSTGSTGHRRPARSGRIGRVLQKQGALIALVVLVVFGTLRYGENFATGFNLRACSRHAKYGLVALGMTS